MRRRTRFIKNCHLDSIYLENSCLYLQIKFPKLHFVFQNELTLLFVERYTTKKKQYPLTFVDNKKHNLKAALTEVDLEELLMNGKDWDVYVAYGTDHSTERIRIHSELMDLELLFFLKKGKMLAPFTTNHGNLSFKSQLAQPFAKVEHINFINKGTIGIKGYTVHPLLSGETVDTKATLVFMENDEKHLIKVPLLIVDKGYVTRGYKRDNNVLPIAFEAVIPIKAFLSYKSEAITFKARIEMSYTVGYKKVTAETSPIVLKSPTFKKQSLVKKVNGDKKRVTISRTKKAKQLHIKLSRYNFKNEIKTTVKGKFLYIKRHPVIKKLYKRVFYSIGMLPKKQKIVVFESFLGKQFSDNPRAIYEYLQDHRYPYKCYWSVDKKHLHNFKDKNLKCIRRFSLKWLLIMPRARFWVTNSRMPLWLPKPKNTIYLQTWHGTPLKRLAADMEEVHMPGTTAENYKKNFIKEAKNWDYLISPNAYSSEIFRRAFQFDKEVVETGYPRNDFICNHNDQQTIDKLKQNYGIPLDKKVILYAPTWRDNQFYTVGKYRFDINLDLHVMKEKLENDYILLCRLHYLISEYLDLTPFQGFAYDFSNHEDIRELYVMSDILITDYSSVFFDYGNLKRPMIFYVYDIDQYRDNLRGFYFNFEQEAPGPLVKTTEEVIQTVKKLEAEGFKRPTEYDEFYNKFCYLECGDSTRQIVEKIFPLKQA
ncbi:CDP-glycerol glycerophosphotransferase family protein [Bacillus sp. V5-8f]|uniref:CDP-glycerol glycerophosphotransferase family protein n=1 Tax=Bacillus sp. V5-8f TaxID=2053044 RepID=UPI000C7649C4|nr:CDP-glycerol glycerophosphotransferase family protein [Bacillus sp. V5-8f]PLT33370.1 CDP-glycerol glycerophosphotransferase family protein [Bacillus sp. V5-8f]